MPSSTKFKLPYRMLRWTLTNLTIILMFTVVNPHSTAYAVDLGQIETDLAGNGVDGWVHGSAKDRKLYVFTYRNPKDFFDFVQMSLITDQADISAQLASLARNDKIRIKGKFLKNPSPQKHIDLESIEVIKKYVSDYETPAYEYEAKIPDDLKKSSAETFLVHAIAGDGQILVLEYKDAVIPVFVKNTALTKNLYRNDVVRVSYKFQGNPDNPTHLRLDESAAEPLKVLEKIVDLHGKPAVVEGTLIMFPKSPEIIFNVFAVEAPTASGLKRQFTLLNTDPNVFKPIREKLQKAWDVYPGEYINGRNKLSSKRVRVKATGVYNEIDPGQANAQIYLKDASAIEILP